MLVRTLTALACVALVSPVGADDTFKLSGQNTKVAFIGTKPNGKHEGGFKTIKGTITMKENDPTTAVFKVDIDLNSMFTDNPQLTNHLKSPDFFNVRRNATGKFVSTKVTKKDDGFEVSGKLTMNGVTKEVSFPATIEATSQEFKLDSEFDINRNTWNIGKRGGVDDLVKLTLKVVARKS
jgi:polyisoprenoid-binding protein YceI